MQQNSQHSQMNSFFYSAKNQQSNGRDFNNKNKYSRSKSTVCLLRKLDYMLRAFCLTAISYMAESVSNAIQTFTWVKSNTKIICLISVNIIFFAFELYHFTVRIDWRKKELSNCLNWDCSENGNGNGNGKIKMSHLVAILFSGNFRDKTPIASTIYKKSPKYQKFFLNFCFKKKQERRLERFYE